VIGDSSGLVDNWPCLAASPIAFAAWHGEGLETVTEVHAAYVRILVRADELLGDGGGANRFVEWWNSTPRDRAQLLGELQSTLVSRSCPRPRREDGDVNVGPTKNPSRRNGRKGFILELELAKQ